MIDSPMPANRIVMRFSFNATTALLRETVRAAAAVAASRWMTSHSPSATASATVRTLGRRVRAQHTGKTFRKISSTAEL